MKKNGFTLAEVLITLAIIGVVAAVSIPSVVANTQQKEFQTGLRKAVSVLNSAITMNMAIDGESPYDLNSETTLFEYLQRHMSVMKSTTDLATLFYVSTPESPDHAAYNKVFYTTDGMRFEIPFKWWFGTALPLYESENPAYLNWFHSWPEHDQFQPKCGSYGLKNNPDNTTTTPCYLIVDVNGDRKPNPANVSCLSPTCAKPYKMSDPNGKKLLDIFPIMITDKQAIPYGVAAQKAMYQAQGKGK